MKNQFESVINFSSDWKSSLITYMLSKNFVSWIHCNPYTMKSAKTQFLNFAILKKSKKIICVCEEQRDILINEYDFHNKIEVIYNCIDEHSISIQMNEKINADYQYMLMVARFDLGSKDYETLIKAYDKLNYSIKNKYKLVLLGNGPDKYKVVSLIDQFKLKDHIVTPGYSDNPYKWMKNATIMFLISKTEGFPLTPIEGMYCRTPIILTNFHTGAVEISDKGKNCVLVPIGDYNMLSNRIEKLVEDADMREKYIMNSVNYIKRFSQDEFERKINRLFKGFYNEK